MNDASENSVGEILRILYYDLWGLKNALKKVYFLSLTSTPFSENAEIIDNFCQIDHSKLWKTYMSHNIYKTRRVILLIDHGNSIDDNLLFLSKLFAKQMISVLNENDKFTIIAIASKWSSLTVSEPCGNEHLPSILTATDNNKELSYSFIDELSSKSEITDHSIGIKTAMKMARLFYAGEETVMLVYISPGMQFSMSEAMDIITVSDISSPLIVNTCSVSSGALPDINDMNILSNIMNDFFIEKNINSKHRISRGHLAFINDQSSIGPAVARFYEMYNSRLHRTTIKVSLPTWDSVSHDLTTTFSIGFPIGNRFIVIGVDLYFPTFLRDIIYYSNYQQNITAILMDSAGTVLIHPSIPARKLERQVKFAHISKYLPQDFDTDMFFKATEGTFYSEITSKSYIWKHIDNIYVICLAVNNIEDVSLIPSKLNWLPSLANSQLLSYLIDLAGSSAVCKQFGQIANMESPSLYLSQSCFHHISQKTNESITLKLLPYFQRDNILMKHEGLQDGIRDELAGLVQAADSLKKKHLKSVNVDYVIRRYVATKTGIAHIFPGASLETNFEPSKRLWFLRADEMRGRAVVSPPYLDAGGAGYIVTISYATPFLVIGIDVTYGFILKMILEQNFDCFNNTCFLVDDRGYLVSHPDIITSLENENEPVEQLHIVHKESSVANDLLNHEELVQKKACNDYASATIQRYYQFNLSFPDVLTSSVLGEPCVSYSIGAIGGTNLFFGIVKAACPITRTFCPCSVVDRICLNCGTMEKQECECPCECQIRRSSCSNYTTHDDYSICHTALAGSSSEPIFKHDVQDDVSPCFNPNCESRYSYLSCLGVAGCEWCRKDTYGFTLETPFCTGMSSCFNGVLGGPSPYRDGNTGGARVFSSIRNTGVALGLIAAFGVVFVLIIFCLRSYNNVPRSSRVYLSARQEHLHMSDLRINDDFLEQGNHSDKLLIEEKKRTPISPYCVTSNYSRPTTAADSDHGYSTMTPHDESEHLSLAPIEIDSLEEDLSSDRATPPIKHRAQMTRIPLKNCIIVPVTVHRHVDAS
ncbi:VWFA and cache domain-containing protein 1 isoform X2 [Coccinella septempunctata]|nr:VWFA and cache domain-containing protein 1 isoform X2 [Coccinella septempunctata]